MKEQTFTHTYILGTAVTVCALLASTSMVHAQGSARIGVEVESNNTPVYAQTQTSVEAGVGAEASSDESRADGGVMLDVDADTPISVEPGNGIGDGAQPLGLMLAQEIAVSKGVSMEVAEIIANASVEHESITEVNIGDQVSDAAVEIRYNTTRKVLGFFDYKTEAVARTSAEGRVRTEYPSTPWYVRLFIFGDSEKDAIAEVATDIAAQTSVEAEAEAEADATIN